MLVASWQRPPVALADHRHDEIRRRPCRDIGPPSRVRVTCPLAVSATKTDPLWYKLRHSFDLCCPTAEAASYKLQIERFRRSSASVRERTVFVCLRNDKCNRLPQPGKIGVQTPYLLEPVAASWR
jgi:hypothetical protein